MGLIEIEGSLKTPRRQDPLQLFRRACEAGFAPGCTELGATLAENPGTAVAEGGDALDYVRKGCDGSDGLGCWILARHYEEGGRRIFSQKGLREPPDPVRAAELYGKGCDANHLPSCVVLGERLTGGFTSLETFNEFLGKATIRRDEQRAAALFLKACEGGEAGGCRGLGRLIANGSDLSTETARVVRVLTTSCDGGEAVPCFALGTLLDGGDQVSKDEARAAMLYTPLRQDSCRPV